MKVVILAGGKGTRLKPYTIFIPKPLVPIGDYPILEIVIRQLKKSGFKDIVLSVNHMSELIRAYFKNGRKVGVNIAYSEENKPLGTAGPLALIRGIGKSFIVMNGDILTDIDFAKLSVYHKRYGQIATIVSCKREILIDLGILEMDRNGYVKGYVEKPSLKYDISAGIYVFDKAVIRYIDKNEHMDLPSLIMRLVKKGEKVKTYTHNGLWFDIGTPVDYENAIKTFEEKKEKFI